MIHTEYVTSDIALAAALRLSNHRMDRISVEGKRGFFHFLNIDSEMVDKIGLDQVLVSPYAFHGEIKHLTSIIGRMRGAV